MNNPLLAPTVCQYCRSLYYANDVESLVRVRHPLYGLMFSARQSMYFFRAASLTSWQSKDRDFLAKFSYKVLRQHFLFIYQMANGVWMVGKTLYTTIVDWFRGRPADLGWR